MHKENQLVETNKTVNLLNVEDLVKASSWPRFVCSFSYFLNPSLGLNLDNSNWGRNGRNSLHTFALVMANCGQHATSHLLNSRQTFYVLEKLEFS